MRVDQSSARLCFEFDCTVKITDIEMIARQRTASKVESRKMGNKESTRMSQPIKEKKAGGRRTCKGNLVATIVQSDWCWQARKSVLPQEAATYDNRANGVETNVRVPPTKDAVEHPTLKLGEQSRQL